MKLYNPFTHSSTTNKIKYILALGNGGQVCSNYAFIGIGKGKENKPLFLFNKSTD